MTLGIVVLTAGVCGSYALPLGLCVGAATVCVRLRAPGWTAEGIHVAWSEFCRAGRPFAISGLTSDAQQLDVALVSTIAGPGAGGVYAGASRLLGPLTLVVAQTSLYVFARASAAISPLTRRQAASLVGAVAACYLAVTAIVFLHCDDLMGRLLGPDFASAGRVLQVMLLGVVMSAIVAPLGGWRNAKGQSFVVARATVASAAIFFVVLTVGAVSGSSALMASAYPVLQIVSFVVLATPTLIRLWRPGVAGNVNAQIPRQKRRGAPALPRGIRLANRSSTGID